jgi:nucleotide-binding universal stress UspA family protein
MTTETYLVPFDGSPLTTAALDRAATYADAVDASVVALAVVPGDVTYARQKGWIAPGEPFDREAIADTLRSRVRERAPEATFESVSVDGRFRRSTIAKRVRRTARSRGADVVFLGSANAGRLGTPSGSIGGRIATDSRYDVFIVRNAPSGGE